MFAARSSINGPFQVVFGSYLFHHVTEEGFQIGNVGINEKATIYVRYENRLLNVIFGRRYALHNRLYVFIVGPFVLFEIFIPLLLMTPK